MTARFIVCAPLELGGAEMTVFAPSRTPATWLDPPMNRVVAYDTFATDGKGTILGGTNVFGQSNKSTDGGNTWAAGTALAGSVISDGLAYADGLWMYHYPNKIVTSPDAVHWTQQATPPVNTGLSWGVAGSPAGLWVTVDQQAADVPYWSVNGGASWTAATGSPAVSTGWVSLTYGGGLFAVLATPTSSGTPSILTSPDGANWTASAFSDAGPHNVLVTNGTVYACLAGALKVKIASSWAALAAAAPIALSFRNLDTAVATVAVDAEGRVIALGNYGSVATSIDGGLSWIEDTVPWPHTFASNTQFRIPAVVTGVTVVFGGSSAALAGIRQGLC